MATYSPDTLLNTIKGIQSDPTLSDAERSASLATVVPQFQQATGTLPDTRAPWYDRFGNIVGAGIDAAGRAIAVPGYPNMNLDNAAAHLAALIPGQPSAEVQNYESDQGMKYHPVAADIGAGAGHLVEGVVGGDVAAPLADAAIPVAGRLADAAIPVAGRLAAAGRGVLTGAASGVGASPGHPVAGALGGAVLGSAGAGLFYKPPIPAVAQASPDVVRAAGFSAPPSDINQAATLGGTPPPASLAARGLESVAGRGPVAANAAVHNQGLVNQLIGQDAGLAPGTAPTIRALQAAQQPFKSTYDTLENGIQDFQPSAFFKQSIQNVGSNLSTLPKSADVETLKALAGSPQTLNGQTLMGTIQEARSRGAQLLASDDPQQNALGRAYYQVANAYENEGALYLKAHPELGITPEQFQTARVGFAKNYLAQEALKGSNFNAAAYARVAQADPDLLSGSPALVAQVAADFPQSMRLAQNVSTAGPGIAAGHGIYGLGGLGLGVGGGYEAEHGHPELGAAMLGAGALLGGARAFGPRLLAGGALTPDAAAEIAARAQTNSALRDFFPGASGVPAQPAPGAFARYLPAAGGAAAGALRNQFPDQQD